MRTCTTLPLILAVGALSPAFALAQQAPLASHLLRGTVTAAGAAVRRRRRLSARVARRRDDRHCRTLFDTHHGGRDRSRSSLATSGSRRRIVVVPVDTADAVDAHARSRDGRRSRRSPCRPAPTRPGNERGATLTALEVVSTPGATADIARAMQTLPGVQNVDEGTGLFVRGGDVSETKVLLNNVVMLSPYNYETPTGNYTVTVNPFLLDGIFFSSGGFGARYGNILSGVADLRTAGRPVQSSETAVAGLASVSSRRRPRARRTASRCTRRPARNDTPTTSSSSTASTRALLARAERQRLQRQRHLQLLARRPRSRPSPSIATTRSASGSTIRRSTAATSRTSHSQMVQSADGPTSSASFAPTVSVSYATVHRNEGFGVFGLGTDEHLVAALHADGVESATTISPSASAATSTGATALHRLDSAARSPIVAPGAPSHDLRLAGGRRAERRVRRSRLARARGPAAHRRHAHRLLVASRKVRTVDPRLSAAYELGDGDDHRGGRRLPSGVRSTVLRVRASVCPALPPDVRACSTVLGAQVGERQARSRASSCTTSSTATSSASRATKHGRRRRHRRRARRGRLREAPASGRSSRRA